MMPNLGRQGATAVARVAISTMLFCMPALLLGAIAYADPADDPVIAAAGDIAGPWSDDEATAALLDAIDPGLVLPLGDMVYPDGTAADFAAYYDPTWGRHKWRSRPVAGNHDYHVPGAADYYSYFGAAAGDPAKGYYAYDIGRWRLYALNTNCGEVGCRDGSEQLAWLRADLAANADRCTLVYTHYPRFSSHVDSGRRDYTPVSALYEAFYSASGDVWLGAHNHFYERFAELDPDGAADPGRGIRTFIAGTGGASVYAPGAPRAGSEVTEGATHGVLKLQLHANSYDWQFVPEGGKPFTDSGTGICEVDTVPPTPPQEVEAVTVGPTRVDLRWTRGQDDVAVTGYELYRDDRRVGATNGETAYSDLTAAPGTEYAYTVAALDAAGNLSSSSSPVKARTDPTDARSFAPVADARVSQASPGSVFPTGSLRVDGGADPTLESYLRFAVEGLGGPVKSARLRVYATTGTANGPAVYATGDGWTETGLTWDSRPARGEVALADRGAIAANGWVEYDVTAAIKGDGSYSFALIGSSSDGVDFRPRESVLPPQLVIEREPGPATSSFAPVADARVSQASPGSAFPTGSLRVDGGADPTLESYLRFAVEGLGGPVKSARLRVYATTGTANGPAVYATGDGWTETGLTWDSRPARGEVALADRGAIAANGWVEYDVTAAIKGDGSYSFALIGSSSDGVQFAPRESSLPPRLVVDTAG